MSLTYQCSNPHVSSQIFGAPFVCMSTAHLHILVSAFYKIYIFKHRTSSNAILSLKMYISTTHCLKFIGKKCKTFAFLTKTALHLIQVNHLLFMLHDLDKCQYFSDKTISQFQFITRKILTYNKCGTKSHTSFELYTECFVLPFCLSTSTGVLSYF
jgi:hypothetical protein